MTTTLALPLIVTLRGKRAVEVTTLEEAVRVCAEFRDTHEGFGIGATDYYRFRTGRVLQGKRKVAQIHYNWRIEQ